MFRPNREVRCCPVCGAPLQHDQIDQFGVPVGYSAQCLECCNYSDIWVNGLREVQCGPWNSPDYESDYGAMTRQERWQEFKILCKLNLSILWQRLQYSAKHSKPSRESVGPISL